MKILRLFIQEQYSCVQFFNSFFLFIFEKIKFMKRLLPILIFAICFSTYAQDDTPKNYNELKFNGLMAVAGAFEFGYERTINDESAFGVSALIPFDRNDITIEYYISPYYRHYFGKKYATGFFLEGFGMLNSTEKRVFIFGTGEYQTDFALGIGLGGKWVSKRGFIGELNLGFGRNLFNTDNIENEVVGKVGITVGYRF